MRNFIMIKHIIYVKVAFKWKNICIGSCAAYKDLILD